MVCCLFSSRRRQTRCALVTGVQTCALPICPAAKARAINRTIRKAGKNTERGLQAAWPFLAVAADVEGHGEEELGSASWRESVCQYVSVSVVAVSLKKKVSISYAQCLTSLT